jgi:molybdopterin-biosynthesis enzyme MoeA-like protein
LDFQEYEMSGCATAFGLIVVGDEMLSGNRQDKHFSHFRELLKKQGFSLQRFWLLPDEPELLTWHLRASFAQDLPVFCCGGIGATPDDMTRQCAAEALGVTLHRHPQAVELIESQYAEATYPTRVLMAELPEGSDLIPNLYNRIPGFMLRRHYFLPGFPEMAWPMAQWVLDTHYATQQPVYVQELALNVLNTPESTLAPLMRSYGERYPELKMFSLPTLGKQHRILLGFRGVQGLEEAFQHLQASLREQGIDFRLD